METSAWLEMPAGGACVAAVQLARLAGECHFFTAVGDDPAGVDAIRQLEAFGVTVHATRRPELTRRALVMTDATGERTIVVNGPRHHPTLRDDLPWKLLPSVDCVLITAADHPTVLAARQAPVVVMTARGFVPHLDVQLDAVVGSGNDADEVMESELDANVGLVVATLGRGGGRYRIPGGAWADFDSPPLRDPVVDRYGAGDAFAAGLAFALAREFPPKRAVAVAAICGTAVLSGRGPYEAQISSAELEHEFSAP